MSYVKPSSPSRLHLAAVPKLYAAKSCLTVIFVSGPVTDINNTVFPTTMQTIAGICKFPASAVTDANEAVKLNGKEGHFFLLY